ncbi:MAG TPA: anaerobic ribonucleoside-triphosphate reductase activating protein [Clostridiales bacterium]|jgi:pyruvate formate lyase activating enzyme|nr:anaerobic ribonucleoside-triphosphate reductase activating protein [Clostridiales bacterium]
MNIQGLVKSSLIDDPGYASTVLFCGGCNFRCAYCHNPELVKAKAEAQARFSVDSILEFISRRRRFIDSVCLTGGEPTLQVDLVDFLRQLRSFNLRLKLDTNGSRPAVLEQLLAERLVDYIALDIKGPPDLYPQITGTAENENCGRATDLVQSILASARLVLETDHEYRTTVCREQLGLADLRRMQEAFPRPQRWYLQQFRDTGDILNPAAGLHAYSDEEMKQLGEALCVSVR